ncbi:MULTISPECIES: flagellar motor protein PomA [Plesiomonas]|uniref:Flagellar motor protein PomA n=2 Tax=Plesiomonas shigelloides TaxID=703 RepID=R8ANQ6_PLESH|nr:MULTISPECIES: flagellar motor protein PomA [Plesiomonas]MCE5162963.1 flagellar motor protein PomA [Plesiomonas sp. PI-19]MDO4687705.1 flagellar motor protein PomA [Plesiomonas sp.]AVQ88446.1 flagellar motor protein PomA [Plesiomonas shigelloides]EON87945.1 flagellar motor protein PomA [Plesiomonas shigelloides 302-73]KAB7661151.1 flagellar motor protein PomA [Plesiomonas shigelloides]
MDLATLIGLIVSFAFIIYAMIMGGNGLVYVDIPSVLIVVGGSIFVVMMKFTLSQFWGAAKIATKAFFYRSTRADDLIMQLVALADAARKGGFLALEEVEIDHPFMRKAVDMLVDGHEQATVRMTLSKDLNLTLERHERGEQIFRAFADVAPAMGMIGTLIGLVAMLANMSDPKSIGPAMAVALITTLYGALIANMIANPIADKLALRRDEEALNRRLIIDGVLAIQDGLNPRVIESLLKNYLHESKRELMNEAA